MANGDHHHHDGKTRTGTVHTPHQDGVRRDERVPHRKEELPDLRLEQASHR
jgi:hypothetical protein